MTRFSVKVMAITSYPCFYDPPLSYLLQRCDDVSQRKRRVA